MKIIVHVELTKDWGEISEHEVIRFERPGHLLGPENVGLSLDDGKQLRSTIWSRLPRNKLQ
jgi:hypothetical protein